MQNAEMAEFIRRARREGVPFDEIDRSLLAEVSGLTASELAEAYREAAICATCWSLCVRAFLA